MPIVSKTKGQGGEEDGKEGGEQDEESVMILYLTICDGNVDDIFVSLLSHGILHKSSRRLNSSSFILRSGNREDLKRAGNGDYTAAPPC